MTEHCDACDFEVPVSELKTFKAPGEENNRYCDYCMHDYNYGSGKNKSLITFLHILERRLSGSWPINHRRNRGLNDFWRTNKKT